MCTYKHGLASLAVYRHSSKNADEFDTLKELRPNQY